MAFLTAERIISTTLGLLIREMALPRTVWRDLRPEAFTGAKNDTLSIRLPAYAPARTRDLRSGALRTKDTLNERKIDVSLDTDIYKDVGISDEEMNLDISDFGAQVLQPITLGVADRIATEIAAIMTGATYANQIGFAYATDDAWDDIIVPARELLNKAHVPMSNRFLAVGSSIESAMLRTVKFIEADKSGTTDALTDATLGRKGGFNIVSAPELGPNEAYAYHQTAYALVNRAPAVPASVAPGAGAMRALQGFSMRMVRGFDIDTVEDRTVFDSWLGVKAVTDEGFFDANGVWVPAQVALGADVTIANPSAALDDIVDTTTAHGFVAGDEIVFDNLTGGAGIVEGRRYYVIAANLAAQTFQFSATLGGAAVNFTSDITAGVVRKGGDVQLVRSVKIVGS